MADSTTIQANFPETIDFKQLRLSGDQLLEVYNNKFYSKDLLENEEVQEKRNSLIKECEQILIENPSAGKIIDFIWKYCFYETISAFKSQRKRFTDAELSVLQKFIQNGIEYFNDLSSRIPQTKIRSLLFKGDLSRYEHKLIKTTDAVLLAAEKCYQEAVDLDPKSGTSYSKLACIYESKNPHIALIFLLRAIINKTTSAVNSLLKLSGKNVPAGFADIFNLSQNVFRASNDNFQASIDSFKQFMDNNSSMSANILIQNLHTACLLVIAIESMENKNEEVIKSLIMVICQYFNVYVPILIEQLNESEILQQRRNCPSPIEENDVGDLADAFAYLGFDAEPTLYENVLYPVIPLLLTLNEWVGYLSAKLVSLKLSVGSRMACQSVLQKFPELLNCFIDILGYRMEINPDDFHRASKWLSTHLFALKKPPAFGVLIDSLKQSISSKTHPLDFDSKFKYDQFKKEAKTKRPVQKIESNFVVPDFLIVSSDSWQNHWPKLLFLLNNFKNSKTLISSNTIKQLEERANINVEYKNCIENIKRLAAQNFLIVYDEEKIGKHQLIEMISEQSNDTTKILLIFEDTEVLNERNALSKNVQCFSASELYHQYCKSIGLNHDENLFPFLKRDLIS